RINLSARQITAIKGYLSGLARLDHRRKNGIDPRGGREVEAIEVVGTALRVSELVEAQNIVAIGRRREVEDAVVCGQRAMIAEHFASSIIDPHLGMEPAVERSAQT